MRTKSLLGLVCCIYYFLSSSNHTNPNHVMCARDQCARTVASVKAKLHLKLRPYYILTSRRKTWQKRNKNNGHHAGIKTRTKMLGRNRN